VLVTHQFARIHKMQLASQVPEGKQDSAAASPPEPSVTTKQGLRISALFVLFTLVRAIHPSIITASKSKLEDGSLGFAYQSASTIVFPPLLICVFAQLIILAVDGLKGWRAIWMPMPMLIFGLNGAIFAFGDWLELESLRKMHGAAYQILNQSKILITALMMMPLKGVYQTRLQWMLLAALMMVMSEYMCIQTASQGSSGNTVPLSAYLFTLLKITCSCLGAVFTDKYAKVYSKTVSLTSQLVQTYLANFLFITAFASCSSNIWSRGFFDGWDGLTVAVTISFGVKASVSYTVVALLDAILKNIGECAAVLLIFFYDVLVPWVDFRFHMPTFLSVIVTILLIGAYMDAKKTVEKAQKWDESMHDLIVGSSLQLLHEKALGA